MRIKNAKVFTEEGIFEQRDVCIDGEYFTTDSHQGKEWDAAGCYAIPGLVDIHVHGGAGYDICDGTMEALDGILDYEARNGITCVCPATMTISEGQMQRVFRAVGNYPNNHGAYLGGITMEGPFISRDKIGAQSPAYVSKPNAAMYARMQDYCRGMIRQVVIAPEEDAHFEMIDSLRGDVVLSVGHTVCDYEMAARAFQRGCRHVTHLYNAMNEMCHRDPGVAGAAADREDVYVELICDGIHNHPSVVRNTFRMFGGDRVCMISDSMRAAGLDSGVYTLGGQNVYVRGKRATLADGTIAGSAVNLMEALKVCVKEMQVPLETAVKAATINPARSLGLDEKFGSIAPGKYANMVLMDKDLNVLDVLVRGKVYI